MAFVWGGNTGEKLTPQQVDRKRIAAALMAKQAGDTSPVASPFAGINRALQGYISGRDERRSTAAENAGLAGADAAMSGVLPGIGGQANAVPMQGDMQAPADAVGLIRGFEGFRETPYWDVNALRTGYGSDTVTMADGSVVPVGKDTRVTREDADRDLARRVGTEFVPRAQSAVGADVWGGLDPQQQASLASITYNYGSLPSSVASAVKTPGTEDDVAAIRALASHNDGVNAGRRNREADIYAGGDTSVSTMGGQGGGNDIASLLTLSADPWVAQKYGGVIDALVGQQTSRDNAAYAQQLQQQDPMYQAQLQQAQLELQQAQMPQQPKPIEINGQLIDPTTMQVLGDYRTAEAAPIAPRPMNDPQERAHWGIPASDTRPYAIEEGKLPELIGGGGVTVNNTTGVAPPDEALRKKLMEGEGVAWSDALRAGSTASGLQQDLDVLDQVIELAPQGPITGRMAEAFPGVSDAAGLFQSVVKRVAPSLRVEGSGSQSDIEYNGMLQSIPKLSNRPEANRAIAGMMRSKAAVNMERAKVISQYQNGEIDAGSARRQMAEIDRKSIITPEMKALIDGLGSDSSQGVPMIEGNTAPKRRRWNPQTGAFE